MQLGKHQRKMSSAGVLALCLLAGTPGGGAQSGKAATVEVGQEENASWHARPFAVVRSAGTGKEQEHQRSFYGSWDEGGEHLREYAKAHGGNYLVYAQAGTLYRVDSPEVLQEADRFSEPLQILADEQRDLAAQQAPLAEQQQVLSEAMRATHDPAIMGRIGHTQGIIGRQQGAIGREQGTIGRQQGLLGRALYQGIQKKLDACLADKSCTATAVS